TIDKREAVSDACGVGYCTQNGGTKGGSGGTTTTVSSLAQLTAAASGTAAAVIIIDGNLSGAAQVRVGSNKSIIGKKGSSLTGIGFYVKDQKNVILRNLKISKVTADNGDAIGIQKSTNVWVDHCDLSSDMNNGKDFYDGLLDITHASEWVTVSNTYLHDHYKASLVGHSDSNSAEDTGTLHITYANNRWENINSRSPSVRFGTVHVFNSYYNKGGAINTRMGAQMLVESTVFSDCDAEAIKSQDSDEIGYAVVNDIDFGGSTNAAAKGTLTSVPYSYSKLGSANVKSSVTASAGQTLSF
ncbi:pectate lyase a, partial [Thozetella sp. PMI_491]